MVDPAYNKLLEDIAAARQRGEPMDKVFEMAEAFLAKQPKDYADGRRNQLMSHLKLLATQAPLLDMMASAKTDKDRLGALAQMFSNLQAAEPQEQKDARRKKAMDALAEAQKEAAVADAEHRSERQARGSSRAAGTGKPGPRTVLQQAPEEPLELNLKGRDSGDLTLGEYKAARAIRDRRVFEQMRPGASRVGGLPDLPPGVEWPRHEDKKLPFVAQLELSEFPASDGLLPPDGWLYAFALVSNEEDQYPPPVAVFTHRGLREALVRADKPDEDDIWQDWGDESLYEMLPIVPPAPKTKGSKKKAEADRTAGWLLGEMDGDFGTPGEVADREFRDGGDWINLLAVESVGSMQWSDCGHLYFLIRRSDLAKGDFSKVLATVASS